MKQSPDSQPSSCSCGITAVHRSRPVQFHVTSLRPFYAQLCSRRATELLLPLRGIPRGKSVWEEKVFHSPTAKQVTMSRKKAMKGKVSSKSPKGSPSSGRDGGRTGKGLAAAAAPSSGLVYPSRPSLSNSGEFYDIAFKVSREILENESINQSINQ